MNPMPYPASDCSHPVAGFPQICFIKNTVQNPHILIGDYTYYDDPIDAENFERNVLYHFPFVGDKLIIGKFCAIARGVKFIMNGGNHSLRGFSTYPFEIFGADWQKVSNRYENDPQPKDTVIGNDVWIGYEAVVMPGVEVGSGAVIGAKSLVTKDVPPYAIVGGNPAKIIRLRFDQSTIDHLLLIAWWDWEIDKITQHLHHITNCDLDALDSLKP